MRFAVISAPRSGNMWIAHSIAAALGYPVLHAMDVEDLPVQPPEDCVLQIHWWRDAWMREYVETFAIQVVTLARHPLDLFLSALWIAGHGHSAIYWLDQRAQIPWTGRRAPPALCTDRVFIDWCAGKRGALFMASTTEWWQAPDTIRLRYEDCVTDPDALRPLAALTRRRMRLLSPKELLAIHYNHIWRATPGIYRRLITPAAAQEIASARSAAFALLGYSVDDYALCEADAAANWRALYLPRYQEALPA